MITLVIKSGSYTLSCWSQVVEFERMSRDVNRSAYTRRILEIVGNIKKQKEEINKVSETPHAIKSISQVIESVLVVFVPSSLVTMHSWAPDASIQ